MGQMQAEVYLRATPDSPLRQEILNVKRIDSERQWARKKDRHH